MPCSKSHEKVNSLLQGYLVGAVTDMDMLQNMEKNILCIVATDWVIRVA
jgi:hypothetical protein